jgi:probable F420-dependent oxidoreductase
MVTAEARPFRFGVNLVGMTSAKDWVRKCRSAEQLGYDVITVPDHLGLPAPFPALAVAAEATERVRLGTFVLNAGFHNPALLAREAATLDLASEGRLELGVGAGYAKAEFDAAGLPWQSAGARVDLLEHTVKELRRRFDDTGHRPACSQPSGPPLLVGGSGNRVLRCAAAYADIVSFSGATQAKGKPEGTLTFLGPDEFASRIAVFTGHAGARSAHIERNLLVPHVLVGSDARTALAPVLANEPDLTADRALSMPTVLAGTPTQIGERLVELRERFELSYITVREPAMAAFAQVMEALR